MSTQLVLVPTCDQVTQEARAQDMYLCIRGKALTPGSCYSFMLCCVVSVVLEWRNANGCELKGT